MASVNQMLARLVDLFGPAASANPAKLYGNLMVSSNGNVLVGGTTDDAANNLQVYGPSKLAGNVTLSLNGSKVLGNFSDATYGNRVYFQSNASGATFTSLGAVPPASGTAAYVSTWSKPDPTNSAFMQMSVIDGSQAALSTGTVGTGTALPMVFNVNGATRLTIATSGAITASAAFAAGGQITSTTGQLAAYGYAGNTNQGVVYLNQAANRYLYYNGSTYSLPGAPLQVTATTVLPLQLVNLSTSGSWSLGPDTSDNFCIYNNNGTGAFLGYGGTAWAANSDERLKNIQSELTNAVEAVKSIRTIRYTWKKEDDHAEALGHENDSRVYVGVIAQDVQKVLPEALDMAESGYLAVRYAELTPLALAAIKEQANTIEQQAAQIQSMRTELDELKAAVAKLLGK